MVSAVARRAIEIEREGVSALDVGGFGRRINDSLSFVRKHDQLGKKRIASVREHCHMLGSRLPLILML